MFEKTELGACDISIEAASSDIALRGALSKCDGTACRIWKVMFGADLRSKT